MDPERALAEVLEVVPVEPPVKPVTPEPASTWEIVPPDCDLDSSY